MNPGLSGLYQAYHDPGVVHKLRDGHSLSGLCFQQVPDKHLHWVGGTGDRDSSGATLPLLLFTKVCKVNPDLGVECCMEAECPRCWL